MMKIRYAMLTAVLMLAAISVNAQKVAVGVRGGLTIPNITPGGTQTPLSEGYSSRTTWGAGAFVEYKFTKTFSLQTGLEYSKQGGKKSGNQAVPSNQILPDMISQMGTGLTTGLTTLAGGLAQAGNLAGASQIGAFGPALATGLSGMQDDAPKYLYADFDSKSTFNYLMLPVQAKFGWDLGQRSPFRFYVSAGLFAAYMMKAERVSTGSSAIFYDNNHTSLGSVLQGAIDPIANTMVTDAAARAGLNQLLNNVYFGANATRPFNNTQDITDDVRRFNFGFIGNVGFAYNFGRNSVFIEGGGNYGFIKLQKNKDNGENRIGAGTLFIGYSYLIGKK